MVRSRKYALITAALALILIAAVVLAIVLTGNGTYYDRAPEGSVSDAEVKINSTTGTVAGSYLFEALTEHSAIGSVTNWTADNFEDTDGDNVEDAYVTTLNKNTYLLHDYADWNAAHAALPNLVGDGRITVEYNGFTYIFKNGNDSGDSLFVNFTTFLSTSKYYNNSKAYGLVIKNEISYDPNATAVQNMSGSWGNGYSNGKNADGGFNATLDGAGAVFSLSKALAQGSIDGGGTNISGAQVGTRIGITDRGFYGNGSNENTHYLHSWNGIQASGMLIPWLNAGTLKNFTISDEKLDDDAVNQIVTSTGSTKYTGSTFGYLAGYVGSFCYNGDYGWPVDTSASIENVAVNVTKELRHSHYYTPTKSGIVSTNDNNGNVDLITGGLVGYNAGATIELASVSFDAKIYQFAFTPWTSDPESNISTNHFGGVVGIQTTANKLSKIVVKSTTSIVGDNAVAGGDSAALGDYPANAWTYMGGVIGTLAQQSASDKFTIEGVLYDFYYDGMYAWVTPSSSTGGDRLTKKFWRGLLLGVRSPGVNVSYSNIYITDNTFAMCAGTADNIGAAGTVRVNSWETTAYSAIYAFDGTSSNGIIDADTNNDANTSFIYVESKTVSAINFSQDDNYMIEISRPTGVEGVMWDVSINRGDNQNRVVYTQNAFNSVGVEAFNEFPSTGSGNYATFSINYASSYTYSPSNNGSKDKIYDKAMVNFPTLSLSGKATISTNQNLSTNGSLEMSGDSNSVSLSYYNDGSEVSMRVKSYYLGESSVGTTMDPKLLLQLEYLNNGVYVQEVENWDARYNVNSYRWTSMAIFGMQTSDNQRFVFAPSSGGTTIVNIDARQIYLQVDSGSRSVAYNGNPYSLIEGTGSSANAIYYQIVSSDGTGIFEGEDVFVANPVIMSGSSSFEQVTNAGAYTVNGSGVAGNDANNYVLVAAPNNANQFTIERAKVKISVSGGSMPYGTMPVSRAEFASYVDYELEFTNSAMTAFAPNDNMSVNFNMKTTETAQGGAGQNLFSNTDTFTNPFPAGAYDLIVEGISGTGSSNYEFSGSEITNKFEVAKRELTITLPAIDSFTYGAQPSVGTPSYSGLITGNRVTFEVEYYNSTSGSLFSGTNLDAGNYYAKAKVTAIMSPGTVNGIDNYKITAQKTPNFSVDKRDSYVVFDYDPSTVSYYKGTAYMFTALRLDDPGFAADNNNIARKVNFQAYSSSDRSESSKVDAIDAGVYYPGAVSEELSRNYNVLGVKDKSGNIWNIFEIHQAVLDFDLATKTVEYNGTEVSVRDEIKIVAKNGGFGENDLETLKAALSVLYNGSVSIPVDAGVYNVTVSLPDQKNFEELSETFGSALTIDKMEIALGNGSVSEHEYDGSLMPEAAATYVVTAVNQDNSDVTALFKNGGNSIVVTYFSVNGEAETSVTSLRDAGSYLIKYSFAGSDNFKEATGEQKFEVTPRGLKLTLKNPDVTYSKEEYSFDAELSTVVPGDKVELSVTVKKDGTTFDAPVKDVGEYEFTFVVKDNKNYTIDEGNVQSVTISPFTLTAQGLNTTVLYNAAATGIDEYISQINYKVLDADGSLIGKEALDVTVEILKENGSPVESVSANGGIYQAKLTVTKSGEFDNGNYQADEPTTYTIYIYKIALRSSLTGSVTFGTDYTLNGILYAAAGQGTEDLEVDVNGAVKMVDGVDIADVESINITKAVLSLSGSDLSGTPATGNATFDGGAEASAVFNGNVFAKRDEEQSEAFIEKPVNAGTYTLTVTLTVEATYKDGTTSHPGNKRPVTISAPFTWTIDPYVIDVTLGQLNKYYTEAITVDDIMGVVDITDVVGIDEQNKPSVTAVSAAIGDGKSYVNAGEYDYDLVLDTTKEGYFNYTLPAVTTGKIKIDPLKIEVNVNDLSVEYGNAIAPTATVTLKAGENTISPEVQEKIALQYSYTLTSSVGVGASVGEYKGVLTVASLTHTENFEYVADSVIAGDLTVNKREIGLKFADVSMTYGSDAFEVSYAIASGSLYGNDELPEVVGIEMSALTLVGVDNFDLSRLEVRDGGYSYNFNGIAFPEESNYALKDNSIANGVLTITPYRIDSVTWNKPEGTLVYTGEEFADLYSVEPIAMNNGDIVTFKIGYKDATGGTVIKNAGNYSVLISGIDVVNEEVPVNGANYDYTRIAAESFNIAKADLKIASVMDAVFADGAYLVDGGVYDVEAHAFDVSSVTYAFGETTYDESRDGKIDVAVFYDGVADAPVNAGDHAVTLRLTGNNNFNDVTLSGITLQIARWVVQDLSELATVNYEASNIEYDNDPHGATLTFAEKYAAFNIPYVFSYKVQGGEVEPSTEEPKNVGTYHILLTIDTENIFYKTADEGSEGEITIVALSKDKITLTAWIPTSAGQNTNTVFYTGTDIYPEVYATVELGISTGNLRIEQFDAFSFEFYTVSENKSDPTIDIEGSQCHVTSTEPALRVKAKGSYYVKVFFNEDKGFSANYGEKEMWMMYQGDPLIMTITNGSMNILVNSGATREYNGLVGIDGRDVIYKDDNGHWRINTELITFIGVDLDGMKNQEEELKVGNIWINVSVNYGVDSDTGEDLYTRLYTYSWLTETSGSGESTVITERKEPTKYFYSLGQMQSTQANDKTGPLDETIQTGPYEEGGVYDFGYAMGDSTATYLIEVIIDNKNGSGSEFVAAKEPVFDDNNEFTGQYNDVNHVATGYVNIAPAEVDFAMLYKSDHYQSGKDMLGQELKNGYTELNNAEGEDYESKRANAEFIMRGVPISETILTNGSMLLKYVTAKGESSSNVTGSNYVDDGLQYEALDNGRIHITVKNSEGTVVYTENGSQNGGITNAGTYTFEFVFDGIAGKYMPQTWIGKDYYFVQQAAEYRVEVSQKEGEDLTVPFGTAFDINKIEDALDVKLLTDGEGGSDTNSGSFDFGEGVDAWRNYVRAVYSEESGIPTEYYGNKSPVGSYYIYYVLESTDPNLEIMMETAESMIEVEEATPEFITDADGEKLQAAQDGKYYIRSENVEYQAGVTQNSSILDMVGIGVDYKDKDGKADTDSGYYVTYNVSIGSIWYRPTENDEFTDGATNIQAVGEYRVYFKADDGNVNGNLNGTSAEDDYFVTIVITKIDAKAYITGYDKINGATYSGSPFTIGYEVRDTSGALVSAAALGDIDVKIYVNENLYTQNSIVNAGDYEAYVTVENSTNYNVVQSDTVKFTIAKADLLVRFGGSDDDFKFIYSRDGSKIDSDTYSFELNNARVDLGDDSNAVVYYLTKDGESIENDVLIELVNAYLEAVKAPGSEDLTIDEWLKENEEYAGYKFTSVNGTNAATDVGTYYPIVVYGGDTNFNKSARLIDNGAYPEITVSKAIVKATVSSTWIVAHKLEYGEALNVASIDYQDVFTSIEWYTREGGATDDSQVDDPATFFAQIGASPTYTVKNNGVYNQGNEVGTYAAAIELEIKFESKNYDLEYTTSVADIKVEPKSVKVNIRDVEVKLGESGQQALVADGVKFNGVYNGLSFGTLKLVVDEGFVFGIAGYGETVVDAGSGKYGVLTVTMSGTLAEGGAMIAGNYSSSVDFALNNANYTIDLYDGERKLTTLGSIDGTPYSVPVSLDVAKAVLRVDFDELTYKWLDETYKESVSEGSGEHQGWWEYATMYTGRNFRRNERLRIQSGYYNGNKWVPYGVYAQWVKLGDIINATELGIVVTDGASGMLAAAGEYSFHLVISSTNYEFERADESRSSAIDVNITISPSEALEVNLDLAPLFTENENGEFWEREFDGMTIKTRTIMGKYLEIYRYAIPQGENALKGEVQLQRTTLGDVTDGVFAKGVNVTLAGDNAVGGSIIYAGDYTLTVNVNMDNMAERTEEAKLKITPAQQENVETEITNRSKSGMTYNGSSIVPSFDFKITVKEALSGVKHTQKVNSYSVRVSKDDEELFTYAVEGGVVNMTDEQRAMLANAGVYTFKLIVDNATMPNLEDGATFDAANVKITIEARPIDDISIRSSYRESFDFKSANGEPVAVSKEDINFIAYYNRDTLLEDGTDYELAFVDEAGKYTGKYTFTVTGKGNFKGTITGTYHIGASVGPTEAPAALTYGADDKIIVKLAVNSLAPGSTDIINEISLAFDDSARLVTEGGTTVSQLRLESISPEGGNFIAVFGGVGAVNAGTYYLSLSFSCEYEYEEGKVIGSGGEISGSEVCKVVVQPASAAAVADSVNAVLTEVNSNNATFVIDGKANVYEYSIDGGTTWVKAYKGENTVTGLTPSEHYTIKFRMNDSNYAEGGVTEYLLSVQLPVDTTMNVDEILAQAQDLAGNFNSAGFGLYVQLMDDLNSVSVADREARAEEIETALAAIEEARSEYMADLQAAIDSAVDTAEKATGKGIGVSAVGTAAVVGGAAMPAALGIGFIFAAARKRKSKEEDLND